MKDRQLSNIKPTPTSSTSETLSTYWLPSMVRSSPKTSIVLILAGAGLLVGALYVVKNSRRLSTSFGRFLGMENPALDKHASDTSEKKAGSVSSSTTVATAAGAVANRDVNVTVYQGGGRSDKTFQSKSKAWGLPPLMSYIVERAGLFAKIHAGFEQLKPNLTLWGFGGVGKTSLALYIAHKEIEVEGVFVAWFDAEDNNDLLRQYRNFLITKKIISPKDAKFIEDQAVIEQFKDYIVSFGSQYFLIYDNAVSYAKIHTYLPLSNCKILVTSQSYSWPNPIPVEQMLIEEARLLFQNITTIIEPQELIDDLIEKELGLLALAITQAAGYILAGQGSVTIEEYLRLYRENNEACFKTDSLPPGSPAHPAIYVTFKMAYDKIAEMNLNASRLLEALSFLPTEIDLETLQSYASLVGINDYLYTQALSVLLEFKLVRTNEQTKNIFIHQLVQKVILYELVKNQDKLNFYYACYCQFFKNYFLDLLANKDELSVSDVYKKWHRITAYANSMVDKIFPFVESNTQLLNMHMLFVAQMAMAYIRDKPSTAIDYFLKLNELFNKNPLKIERKYHVNILEGLMRAYRANRESDKAITIACELEIILGEDWVTTQNSNCIAMKGFCYFDLGSFSEAKMCFEMVLGLEHDHKDERYMTVWAYYTTVLNFLRIEELTSTDFFGKANNYEATISYFGEIEAWFDREAIAPTVRPIIEIGEVSISDGVMGLQRSRVTVNQLHGIVCILQGNFDLALDKLELAQRYLLEIISDEQQNHYKLLHIALNIAQVYIGMQRYSDARNKLEFILAREQRTTNFSMLVDNLYTLCGHLINSDFMKAASLWYEFRRSYKMNIYGILQDTFFEELFARLGIGYSSPISIISERRKVPIRLIDLHSMWPWDSLTMESIVGYESRKLVLGNLKKFKNFFGKDFALSFNHDVDLPIRIEDFPQFLKLLDTNREKLKQRSVTDDTFSVQVADDIIFALKDETVNVIWFASGGGKPSMAYIAEEKMQEILSLLEERLADFPSPSSKKVMFGYCYSVPILTYLFVRGYVQAIHSPLLHQLSYHMDQETANYMKAASLGELHQLNYTNLLPANRLAISALTEGILMVRGYIWGGLIHIVARMLKELANKPLVLFLEFMDFKDEEVQLAMIFSKLEEYNITIQMILIGHLLCRKGNEARKERLIEGIATEAETHGIPAFKGLKCGHDHSQPNLPIPYGFGIFSIDGSLGTLAIANNHEIDDGAVRIRTTPVI